MVSEAISWLDVQASERVLDLFSGIGNFTFSIGKLSSKVIGIEGVQEMVDRASHNATKLGVENAEFYQANLADLNGNEEWSKQGFDKILLDPARAGAQGIVEQLGQFNASKIVYVSCNPSTWLETANLARARLQNKQNACAGYVPADRTSRVHGFI